jgi:cytochrome c-type biogenesis protein CcmF
LSIKKNGNFIKDLQPETRFYPVEKSNTAESSIYSDFLADLYTATSEYDEENKSILIRIYYKPLMLLVWVGAFMMAIGAAISGINQFKLCKLK